MDAWLAQFPARDVDEPVTKDFVDRRFAEARTDIVGIVNTAVDTQRKESRQQFQWLLGVLLSVLTAVAVTTLSLAAALG